MIYTALPSAPELAERSTCSMLDPMTTKQKKPSITGPTEKSFFFVPAASTVPRRLMFPWNFFDRCFITRELIACERKTASVSERCDESEFSRLNRSTRSRRRARVDVVAHASNARGDDRFDAPYRLTPLGTRALR